MFDKKALTRLILFLATEQILFASIGIADMLMVAAAGEQSVSAISLVDSLNLLFHSIFSALAAGGGILFTQYFGRRDYENANYAAKHLIAAAILLSVLVAVVCFLGNHTILYALYGSAEEEVLKLSVTYFYLALSAYPMVMLYDTCACIFRGMGNTEISLCGAAVSCFSNIILNAIFIYGLNLGVLGAGLASLAAKTGGAMLMIFFLIKAKGPIRMRMFFRTGWDKKVFINILRLAVPIGLEDSIFHVGKLLVQGVVASFGTAAIAANAVALTISEFTHMAGGAMGLAATTVVGQCMGANEAAQAEKYTKTLVSISWLVTFFICLITYLAADPIAAMYHLSQETAGIASQIIRVHAIACTMTWVLAFNIPSALRAASDVKFILIFSVLSMWIFRVGCSYLFREILDAGVLCVWLALFLDWGFRAFVYTMRFRSGKWKTKTFI